MELNQSIVRTMEMALKEHWDLPALTDYQGVTGSNSNNLTQQEYVKLAMQKQQQMIDNIINKNADDAQRSGAV
jgi:hypothetical protein